MDPSAASDASTSSPYSSSKSSKSGQIPGEPRPPIDPPRRRSSLYFSKILQPTVSPSQSQHQPDAKSGVCPPAPVAQTPNTGRKRGNVASILRERKATPGHHANMQKIFQDAQAHLQIDMAFASSPGGSIESRLPFGQIPRLREAVSGTRGAGPDDTPSKIRDWRYSTAPGLVAGAHIDVREPFPEADTLLPDLATNIVTQVEQPAAEPVSSGFNSPADGEMDHSDTENEQMLPRLPDTSPLTSRFVDMDAIAARRSSSSPCQRTPLLTSLERPLTEMEINSTVKVTSNNDHVLPGSDYLQKLSASPELLGHSSEESAERQIFLSTPAKAAAESARVKRGLERSGVRSTSDKENVPPEIICPDPAVHTNPRVIQCPDPRRHTHGYASRTRSSTPSKFWRQSDQNTPNPYLHNYQPSPSPLRGSLYPPVPQYRQTDSSGSPLLVLKMKSSPSCPGPSVFDQRRSHFFNGESEYHRPPTAIVRPPLDLGPPPCDTEHFQPGWSNYPPDGEPPKPQSLTYAFSTAAGKVGGSSKAPDLWIRDSYRTDTLTPLSRPATRFRKNGIGAIAARGVVRPHPTGNFSPSTTGYGNGRPRMISPSNLNNMASPDRPLFLSSPPRQSDYSNCMPLKRRHPMDCGRGFDIAEESQAASISSTSMEIDEDIQAAVRMSIAGVSNSPLDETGLPGLAGIRRLSPSVSPFRKGKDKPAKRLRTASYWDHDLPEVRRIDQARIKRPSSVEAGTRKFKSMRIREIRSSPPRHIERSQSAIASRAGTVASASVYSQAGLSEMFSPEPMPQRSHEEAGIDHGHEDEVMADVEEGDDVSEIMEMPMRTTAMG